MAPRQVDERRERLRAALAEFAAQDLPDVLVEARREARDRVRAALVQALTEAMLDQAQAELRPQRRPAGSPEQARPRRDRQLGDDRVERQTPDLLGEEGSQRARRDRDMRAPTDNHGLYIYCVVSADTELPTDLTGIDPSHSPTLIRHDSVAAVTSKVPLDDFEEEQLRQRLGDMEWVEKTARAHQQALETIGETATLIPMRMCSVYLNEGGVVEMLEREAIALEQALDHLQGKSEWGVKIFAEDAPPAETPDSLEDATGTDYMRRRQGERDARLEANERLREAAAMIHEQLNGIVTDALSVPLQRPEVSGHDGEMLHNGVYLVEDGGLEEFLATVAMFQEKHRADGLQLEPTGPWAAYNFVPGTIGAAW